MYIERAAGAGGFVSGPSREATAKGVAQQLRDIAFSLEAGALLTGGDLAQGSAIPLDDQYLVRPDYLLKVRALLTERSVRRHVFGMGLVDDPAWAIMLDLFEAHLSQAARSVKCVTIASGAPSTTALRHIMQLEKDQLIERRADMSDKRRIIVNLTEGGKRKMFRYFNSV